MCGFLIGHFSRKLIRGTTRSQNQYLPIRSLQVLVSPKVQIANAEVEYLDAQNLWEALGFVPRTVKSLRPPPSPASRRNAAALRPLQAAKTAKVEAAQKTHQATRSSGEWPPKAKSCNAGTKPTPSGRLQIFPSMWLCTGKGKLGTSF